MGRGQGQVEAAAGFAVLGKGRHGTKHARLTESEKIQREIEEAERAKEAPLRNEIAAQKAAGGKVVVGDLGEEVDFYTPGQPYCWYNAENRLHRDDGPALFNGTDYEYYQNGELHRDDAPAIINGDSSQHWYQNGKLHRDDGPALFFANGDYEWYREGQLHCDNGPAVVYQPELEKWYRNGQLHREDGPAVEAADGKNEWWLNGKHYRTQAEFEKAKASQQ